MLDPAATPLLVLYGAAALLIAVVWSLACFLYDSVLNRRSPMVTWILGLAIIALPAAVYVAGSRPEVAAIRRTPAR